LVWCVWSASSSFEARTWPQAGFGPALLPILPTASLRRYSCAEPNDTRFRAVARLKQSIWREQQGYTGGRYVDAKGRSRRLGSRVTSLIGPGS
jgi:hypothetical protein